MAPRGKKRKEATAPPAMTTNATDATAAEPPKITFMDLPVEIRCEIYGYVLKEAEPIRLRVQFHKKKNGPREIVRVRHSRDPKHHGQVYDKATRSWVPRPFTHSSILLASRQINEEATPSLFAANRFSFESTTALKDFMELVGGARGHHVRHVIIEGGGYKTTNVRGAFKALTVAKRLRALEIDHSILCSGYGDAKITPAKLVDDCKTLMKSLQASYKALNLSGSVRDVLSIILSPCTLCTWGHEQPHARRMKIHRWYSESCGCDCNEAEKKNAALQHDVRALVAKSLGLEEPGSNTPAV